MLNDASCRARQLRLRYRIPLSELAKAAGVSIQLINKIELERERQTTAHERLLRDAFVTVIECRRTQLDALERELAQCDGLFQTIEEGDEYGL